MELVGVSYHPSFQIFISYKLFLYLLAYLMLVYFLFIFTDIIVRATMAVIDTTTMENTIIMDTREEAMDRTTTKIQTPLPNHFTHNRLRN